MNVPTEIEGILSSKLGYKCVNVSYRNCIQTALTNTKNGSVGVSYILQYFRTSFKKMKEKYVVCGKGFPNAGQHTQEFLLPEYMIF